MKHTEAKQGRTFVIRLEDGDILHQELERFAKEQNIKAACVSALGGADTGSRIIVGPQDGRSKTIEPMEHVLTGVHEATGTGTIFCDKDGTPLLHMHLACGREDHSVTGCVRSGVKVWHIMEVVIQELLDCQAVRAMDIATGFKLLKIL